jgi:hypothetical protein
LTIQFIAQKSKGGYSSLTVVGLEDASLEAMSEEKTLDS